MNRYTIRKIESADYPKLLSLFEELAIFEKLLSKMTNSLQRMKNEKDFIKGFVAVKEDNEIIAYATYFFAYYTWTGKSIYMDDLYVRLDFRGQGIGPKLIKKIIGVMKDEKCHKLRWQVSKWNKSAINFYKKLGATVDNIELNCDLLDV